MCFSIIYYVSHSVTCQSDHSLNIMFNMLPKLDPPLEKSRTQADGEIPKYTHTPISEKALEIFSVPHNHA